MEGLPKKHIISSLSLTSLTKKLMHANRFVPKQWASGGNFCPDIEDVDLKNIEESVRKNQFMSSSSFCDILKGNPFPAILLLHT